MQGKEQFAIYSETNLSGREASTHRTQNCNGVSEPLLVTELVDGVFIGCTINHMIVDDTSFWYETKAASTIAPTIFWAPVQLGMVTMKEGELLKLGLDHAAWQLNKVISTYTEAEASHQLLESWVKNPKPSTSLLCECFTNSDNENLCLSFTILN
ncbi:hypothetical protein CK203_001731 [Vitis vinifera]|uniref:Uncharacterized protein n=1 Tax=Vitis vinifera TaxID=29760 RepID=A0A438KJC2_VITVI|nr:hypothetical protein CK203_001731 [Vitis vinifera]